MAIGLDNMTEITSNLHANPGNIDNLNHGWNWWEDYCNWLVTNQLGSGTWSFFSSNWSGPMATGGTLTSLLPQRFLMVEKFLSRQP